MPEQYTLRIEIALPERFELHIHHHGADAAILHKLETIMVDQVAQTALLQGISDGLDGVSTQLTATGAQLTKGLGEIEAEIAALKAASGGNSTPAMDALFTSIGTKLTALKSTATDVGATAQTLDDLNPDTPPTP
jgi:hypothetical protein